MNSSFLFLIVFGILLLTGCIPVDSKTSSEKFSLKPTKGVRVNKIKVGGDGTVVLGEISPALYSQESFESHIEQLLKEQRFFSANQFIKKYPELALDILRNTFNEQATQKARKFIAQSYDYLFRTAGSPASWSALLQARSQSPEIFITTDQQQKELLKYLKSGLFAQAAQLPLLLQENQPHPQVFLSLSYLKGISFLIQNKEEEALGVFQKGIIASDPYQKSQFLLLTSELHSRLKKEEEAVQAWQEATEIAQALPPALLPAFWELAFKLKPEKASWPQKTTPAKDNILSFSSDREVWEQIGEWRLERNEGQNALIAFRRCQSLERNPNQFQQLELKLSRALIQIKQTATATPGLLQLARDSDPHIAAPALALLGVIELRRNNPQRGIGLLLKAIEHQPDTWTGRSEALADLGLGYLMLGEEAEGLRYLHEAQSSFLTQQRESQVLQSLRNELVYFETVQSEEQIAKLHKKISYRETSYPFEDS